MRFVFSWGVTQSFGVALGITISLRGFRDFTFRSFRLYTACHMDAPDDLSDSATYHWWEIAEKLCPDHKLTASVENSTASMR